MRIRRRRRRVQKFMLRGENYWEWDIEEERAELTIGQTDIEIGARLFAKLSIEGPKGARDEDSWKQI
jgi:hypothetical protein